MAHRRTIRVRRFKHGTDTMSKPYHNKGFGKAFLIITLAFFVLPVVLLMMMGDTYERFTNKYFPKAECWETAKHERVCKQFQQL